MTLSDDLNGCAALVEQGDPDRFLAAMAAPVDARRVLFPLYAFNVEIARAPWVTQEAMIAEMRLQWWRDALAEIAEGGPVRRHEVATPLADVLDRASAEQMDEAVLARRWDIYRDPFEDAAAFDAHLDRTSGHLLWAATRALGAGAEAEAAVRQAAWAAGLAAWFQAIPVFEEAGRKPLVDGRSEAVRALAGEGLDRLKAARQARGAIAPSARPAMLAVWLAGPILEQAKAAPERVANGSLGVSEARRKLSLMAASMTGRW
ncbi:squalene/phytoene synthase family protein [Chachezhania antarctica]|uniref:squalene/phytoene synthase family protein n=1 Tax=Chachezhania antarctica TaxID=2340860 RepID=UPI000EAED179|nr:squalene/phytoene synthase family protein [Chachezhania antarctica]